MKIQYFADTDTLYINIRDREGSDSGDVGPDMLADYDEDGAVVALTIEHASVRADLGSVEVQDVPHVRLIGHHRPEGMAVGQ